jgi:heme-degrading monooxygenase HmoA
MYALMWEFRVSREREAAFRQAYGCDGDWARLFRRSAGFLSTELLEGEHKGDERRFLTVDRWASVEDYEAFHAARQAEYHALDQVCEALTERETFIGAFTTVAQRRHGHR